MLIAGTDEAGRGPLAGPVVAAAAVLTDEQTAILLNSGLNDSKKLSERRRESLFSQICDLGVIWRARSASSKRVDEMNVLYASLWAMRESVKSLPVAVEMVIVDGNFTIPELDVPQKAVIKADSKYPCVMAASVIAKVLRDRTMVHLASLFPCYGFEKHKGYPTEYHRQAIKKNGLSPVHRRTFTVK